MLLRLAIATTTSRSPTCCNTGAAQGLADAKTGRHEAGVTAEALAAATKEAALLRERLNQATNRMGQLEHKVGGCTAGLPGRLGSSWLMMQYE